MKEIRCYLMHQNKLEKESLVRLLCENISSNVLVHDHVINIAKHASLHVVSLQVLCQLISTLPYIPRAKRLEPSRTAEQ